MSLAAKISTYLQQLEQQQLLRSRQLLVHQQEGICFSSNDYLSLSTEPELKKAYEQGFARHPFGSGASMVLSGYHPTHQAVEQAFAELLAVDECLLFASGYAANLAVAALLGQIAVSCFIDKRVHASIYDGLTLAQVPYQRFLHNDALNLAEKISAQPEALIWTEGVFSMSGQIAPLAAFAALGLNTACLLMKHMPLVY